MFGRRFKLKNEYLIAVVMAVIVYSCSTPKPVVDTKDLSYLYNPLKTSINPRYSVFNETDEKSVLSVKFFSTDLYFNEANPTGTPMALMTVLVKVFNLSQGMALADTALYNLDITKDKTKLEYLYKIPLKV